MGYCRVPFHITHQFISIVILTLCYMMFDLLLARKNKIGLLLMLCHYFIYPIVAFLFYITLLFPGKSNVFLRLF